MDRLLHRLSGHDCSRSHSTKHQGDLFNPAGLRMEEDAECSVDDGDIVLSAPGLFVAANVLVWFSARDGNVEEDLVRLDNVPPVAGEEVLIHFDMTDTFRMTLQLQNASGCHEKRIQIRNGAARHDDISGDGRYVANLLASLLRWTGFSGGSAAYEKFC